MQDKTSKRSIVFHKSFAVVVSCGLARSKCQLSTVFSLEHDKAKAYITVYRQQVGLLTWGWQLRLPSPSDLQCFKVALLIYDSFGTIL